MRCRRFYPCLFTPPAGASEAAARAVTATARRSLLTPRHLYDEFDCYSRQNAADDDESVGGEGGRGPQQGRLRLLQSYVIARVLAHHADGFSYRFRRDGGYRQHAISTSRQVSLRTTTPRVPRKNWAANHAEHSTVSMKKRKRKETGKLMVADRHANTRNHRTINIRVPMTAWIINFALSDTAF
jgi:hypothetical protein